MAQFGADNLSSPVLIYFIAAGKSLCLIEYLFILYYGLNIFTASLDNQVVTEQWVSAALRLVVHPSIFAVLS